MTRKNHVRAAAQGEGTHQSSRFCWVALSRPLATVLAVLLLITARPALADSSAASGPGATEPAKIQTLLELLKDPEVRDFLGRAGAAVAAPKAQRPEQQTMAVTLGGELESLRNHLGTLVQAVHELPSQTEMAHAMALGAVKQRGLWSTVSALVAFVVLGFGTQWLFHFVGGPARRWLLALRLDTVDERVRAVFARLVYSLGLLLSYALGSIGAFLLFDWPELIKQLLLGYLVAFLLVRLSTLVGRFLLAPGASRFRVVPVSTTTAWFFYLRLLAFAVILGFGAQTIDILSRFGFSPSAQELSKDALGLVLVVLALETLWRMPPLAVTRAEQSEADRHRQRIVALILSFFCVLLWIFWAIQALLAFWLLVFAVSLPLVIITARASVSHVLRPAGTDLAAEEAQSFQAVLFERGVRSVIIITAALLLAWIFNVDVISLTMEDTIGTRLLRGAISVVVIGLVADMLWTVVRATIDRKLQAPLPRGNDGLDAGHAARLQTLLPIVSNILLAAIVIVSAMMILAALGVQIGPLIASAGVVGVAIGFGAQTLVKDIISGVFYLIDDAFRIGEYIQSGTYKGTVESFSLRSVKLRHQRGALYTVPFGVLGAVQNQSRDWVVDKIIMNVPYGTDLDKVRKLIKKIGTALSEDPEFGPEIISPLKMQGVAQFGDYAIQIQTKMMTKPGDVQFAARRRALLMIKLAFEENGIAFAVPTVQMAGDQVPATLAAQVLRSGAVKEPA